MTNYSKESSDSATKISIKKQKLYSRHIIRRVISIMLICLVITFLCLSLGCKKQNQEIMADTVETFPFGKDQLLSIESTPAEATKETMVTEPATEPTEIYVPQPDFFDPDISFRKEYIITENTLPYALFSPQKNGKLLNDSPMALIVWLHGANQRRIDANTYLQQGIMPVFTNWKMEGFRAYILCPQIKGGHAPRSWSEKTAADCIQELVNTFINDHNIDTNNIVIAGHSLGGQGSLYMAHHFNGILYPTLFSKCFTLSPYNPTTSKSDAAPVSDIHMPIRVFSGNVTHGESEISASFSFGTLRDTFGYDAVIEFDANHGEVVPKTFAMDKNKNKRSDIIEWCFDMDEDNKLDNPVEATS